MKELKYFLEECGILYREVSNDTIQLNGHGSIHKFSDNWYSYYDTRQLDKKEFVSSLSKIKKIIEKDRFLEILINKNNNVYI